MKKTLLALAAFVCVMSANAQGLAEKRFTGKLDRSSAVNATVETQHSVFKKAPRKAATGLAANQRYGGNYDTDEVTGSVGLGSILTGDIRPAIVLFPSDLSKFVGMKIVGVRFAMGADATASGISIYAPNDASQRWEEIASVDTTIVSTSVENRNVQNYVWNTVMLPKDKQIDIDENSAFRVAYTVNQTADNYPIAVNANVAGNGLRIYANVPASAGGSGEGWYNFGSDYGAAAIQFIVEGDFPSNDLSLLGFATDKTFYKPGDKGQFVALVNNFGSVAAKYELNLSFDDNKLATLTNANSTTQNESLDVLQNDTIYGTFTVPASAVLGSHSLKVNVASINGSVPTAQTDDDTLSSTLKVYTQTVPRQKNLIEHFTSWTCTYCYLGENFLSALAKSRDDIAWVSIHGNMNSNIDPANNAQCDTIVAYQDISGFPSASFNRSAYLASLLGGENYTTAISVGEEYLDQIVPVFSQYITRDAANNPSFVTLNVTPTLNNRKLTLNVTGTGVEGAKSLIGDQRLYVYLTEDSVVFNQYTNGQWIQNENHDHVFDAALGTAFGNPISWDGDNFSATYTYDIPDYSEPKNMKAVVFVAPRLDLDDYTQAEVNQTEQAYLVVPAGINGVKSNISTDNSVVARYNEAGQRIAQPQRGLNILKLANGKTVKVVVK